MSKYPDHIIQRVLVPRDRLDVLDSVRHARVIAERYGAKPGGKVERQANYFAFRQYDPSKIKPGSYVSFKSKGGVVVRKGLPIDRDLARENPSNDNSVWWLLGGAAAIFVGASVLAARNATASPAPDPIPTPTPIPMNPQPTQPTQPTPRPDRPAPYPTIVRQTSGFSPYVPASIRILQQQLKDLGYAITRVFGIYGLETTAAVNAFLGDAGMSTSTSGIAMMIAVDQWYAHVFAAIGA